MSVAVNSTDFTLAGALSKCSLTFSSATGVRPAAAVRVLTLSRPSTVAVVVNFAALALTSIRTSAGLAAAAVWINCATARDFSSVSSTTPARSLGRTTSLPLSLPRAALSILMLPRVTLPILKVTVSAAA